MNLKFISKNKDGNYYIGYTIPVNRRINPKEKETVEELIIIGVNKEKFNEFCLKHNIKILEK